MVLVLKWSSIPLLILLGWLFDYLKSRIPVNVPHWLQAKTAAALYRKAAADQDESLFEGVDLQPGEPGPSTSASGAIGGSEEAELAAAAAASLAFTPGVGVEPMDE